MGALQRLDILEKTANDHQKQELRNGLNRLMNDNEMGELFKVIALAPKNFPSLEGFTCAPLRDRKGFHLVGLHDMAYRCIAIWVVASWFRR